MVVLVALVFRLLLRRRLVDQARERADRGVQGRMEGHAEMDMASPKGRSGRGCARPRASPPSATATISWNYTAILDLVFLALAAVLVIRFLRTGGPEMLKMMSGPPAHEDHGHAA